MKHLNFLLVACLLVAFTVLAFCGVAHAADTVAAAADAAASAATPSTSGTQTYTMDFTGAAVACLGILSMGILAGLTAAYKWASGKFTWIATLLPAAKFNSFVQPLLTEAANYAAAKLSGENWLKVETKNAAIATAVNYALEHGGEVLEGFGYSRKQLEQKLEAKLVELGYITVDTTGTAPAAAAEGTETKA